MADKKFANRELSDQELEGVAGGANPLCLSFLADSSRYKLSDQELKGVAGGDLSPEHGSGRILGEGRAQECV